MMRSAETAGLREDGCPGRASASLPLHWSGEEARARSCRIAGEESLATGVATFHRLVKRCSSNARFPQSA
jgi:hypothetical protein